MLANAQLSEFFYRHEILYPPVVHKASDGRRYTLAEVNQQHIAEYDESQFIDLLQRMDGVRAHVNSIFTSDIDPTKDIGFRVTSGWRCKFWERLKGRTGSSQHVKAAVDIQPTNCSKELAVKILRWIAEEYWSMEEGRGWFGGFALALPTYFRNGKINKIGFAHFDLASKRRWHYPR